MGYDKRLYLSFYHSPVLHSQGLDRRVQNFTEGPFYTITLTSLNTREIPHHKKVISVGFLSPLVLSPQSPSPPPSSELSKHSVVLFISPPKDDKHLLIALHKVQVGACLYKCFMGIA